LYSVHAKGVIGTLVGERYGYVVRCACIFCWKW